MRDTDSIRKKLSRRQYATLVAGSGMAALAGCPSDGDSGTDTTTEDPTDTGTDTESTETDESTPDPEDRMSDTARISIINTPSVFNWNPHTPSDNTNGDLYMSDMYGFYNNNDASQRLYGDDAVFEAPWAETVDEIDILTWIKEFRAEPPYDMWNVHDERSSFWNGDPNDAVNRYRYDRVRHFVEGNKYVQGQTHRAEANSQWEYHWWFSDGSLEGSEDEAQNQVLLDDEAAATGGDPPLPREWSDPHVRQFEATSTEEEYNSYIEEVRGDRISLERLAENGWGSGPYELRSTDDIASDNTVLRLRTEEDSDHPHPHAEHITIPNLQIQWGNQDRRQTLANNGRIDLHEGSVTPNNQWNPESLPDHVKEITSYLRPNGGDAWWFNMNNEHLQNLWVRRALVTAIDWHQVGANGWGPQRSVPLEHDTGTLDVYSQAIFSEDFLDSLHTYTKEADLETANEYMERGGYTRDGNDVWNDPDGNTFELDVLLNSSIGDWVGACQTIRQRLEDWGVNATLTSQPQETWSNQLDTFGNTNAPNYETTIHWYNPSNQFMTYKSQAAWWDNGSLLDGGPPDAEGGNRRSVSPGDEWTISGEPVQVHLPTDPGAFDAPDQAGAKPDLEGVVEYEEADMAQIFQDLRAPADEEGIIQELFEKCAKFYNYYLPHFTFHQYTYGEWANVRDFNFPEADSEALDWEHDFNITDTLTLGGIMQASYDDSLARE